MKLLNRRQFRKHWENLIGDSYSSDNSPLWIPEQSTGKKSRWFVSVQPIQHSAVEYRIWCTKNCRGQILCYSSGHDEEWYGFSHHADIVLWVLKWA